MPLLSSDAYSRYLENLYPATVGKTVKSETDTFGCERVIQYQFTIGRGNLLEVAGREHQHHKTAQQVSSSFRHTAGVFSMNICGKYNHSVAIIPILHQ